MAGHLPTRLAGILAFLLLLCLAAAGPALASQTPKSITVAIGEDYPPFNAVDEQGRPWGWLVDFWRLWSTKTGIQVKFVAAPFGQTLRLVGEGKVDVHGGCFYSKERARYLDYVAPLLKSSTSFFFNKGIFGIRNVVDLAPFRVGVIKGDFVAGYLREKLPEVSLAQFDTNDELFTALKAGEVRVFALDTPVALYFLEKWGLLADYSFLPDKPLYTSEFRAAVKKGDQALARVVAAGLARITPAERVAIERRWSGVSKSRGQDVLIVACERGNQPLSFLSQTGRPSGVLVDLWRLWAAKTGRPIEFVFGNRSDVQDWVRQGKADIISGLVAEPYMESRLAFSAPLFTVQTALFHRLQDGPILPGQLSGQSVGVLKDSFLIGLLAKRIPGVTFEQMPNRRMLARSLHKGELRAVAAISVNFSDTLEHMGYSGEIVRDRQPLSVQSLRAGMSRGRAKLLEILNRGLRAISRQEVVEIEKRWVPDETLRHFANSGIALELSPAEKKWLAQRQDPVVAAAEMDWPPFDFMRDGKPTGYSIELLRLAAQKAGLPLRFLHGPDWSQLLEKFRSGEIDILPAVYKTPERAREMAFTQSYAANPTVLVTHEGSSHLRSLQNLAGKKLAVIKGFSISRMIMEEHPHIQQVVVKNVLEGLKAVSLQKADAFVGSLGVISYVLNENVIPNVRIVDEITFGSPESTRLHMATRQDQIMLSGILQKALDAVSQTETQRLKHRWLPISFEGEEIAKEFVISRQDKKWLQAHPEISLGVDPNWMPFEGLGPEGAYQGVAAGFVELLGKKLGVSLKPVMGLTWPQVLSRARQKKLDLLPAAMRTPQRERYLLFTKPYLSFPAVVVTREDAPVLVKLEDLRGKTIAVPMDNAVYELIRRDHPELTLKPAADITQGLAQVAQGEADAYVGNMAAINYHLKEQGIKGLKIAATTQYNFEMSMAVRKDWPQFAAMVQRALDSITREEKASITSQWINVRFTGRIDWGFIAKAGGGAALVVAIILAIIITWNRRMAREVAQRKEAEERVAAMVANVPGAIFQLDIHPDGRREYRYLSPRAEEFFNLPPEQIIREKKLLPWHPEDRERVNQEIDASIGSGENVDVEARIIPPGGEPRWIRLTASAEGEGGGDLLATGFILDVTARKEAEERFRNLAANVPGVLFQFTTDKNGQMGFTYLNQRAQEFFGAPPEVIVAEKRLLNFHPEDKDRAIGEINQALAQRKRLNLVARIIMPGGETAWVRVTASPTRLSEDEIAFNGFILNITERKKAEMEFIAAERKVKAMSQAVDDALIMIDGQGQVVFWNPAAERLFGYSEAEAMGQRYHALTAPEEYQDKIARGLQHFAQTGEGPVLGTTTEITGMDRQGRRFPVEVTLSSFQLEEQWFAVGTVRDISQRKAAEEALQESEERSRSILDSAGEGIFGVDNQGSITFINPAAVHMLGFNENELLGQKVHPLIHHHHTDGSDYPLEECPMWASYAKGQTHHVDDEVLWRKDGASFPVEYASTPIAKEGKVIGAVITFRDTTERRQAEEELRRNLDELERFSRLTIGREERMIALKQEINELLEKGGQQRKYKIVDQADLQ